jgi:lipoate-protein ligase A
MTPVAERTIWRILSSSPADGESNMRFDRDTLAAVESAGHPPVLRFFRWKKPGASYGKHQRLDHLRGWIPDGMDAVQRPTGGGLVIHGSDLCFSLCWRSGQDPLPVHVKDHYAWIHGIAAKALQTLTDARLAACSDCSVRPPLSLSRCFQEPVGYDVLANGQKIVGGALCRQHQAFLYQGSVQGFPPEACEPLLHNAFRRVLNPE